MSTSNIVLIVFLSVCVLHWLTSDPKHDERGTRARFGSLAQFSQLVSTRSYSMQKNGPGPLTVQEIDVSQLKRYDLSQGSPVGEVKLSFLSVRHGDK